MKNCYRGCRFFEGKGEVWVNLKIIRNGIEKEGVGRECEIIIRSFRVNVEVEWGLVVD